MFAHARHQVILETLQERSVLTVPELEKMLDISPATVRRDLAFLERLGKVVRTHGGILHPDQVDGEVSFDRKSRSALKAKHAIAEAAQRLVKGGQTVFVDAGTTALEVGRGLASIEGLTIFTNSIPLLQENTAAGTRLIAVGGEVRALSLALVGAEALGWLSRIRLDVAFLGTSGIDINNGPTTTELTEAGVKGAVVRQAARTILLADASKWAQPAAIRYEIDDLVTDYHFPEAERKVLNTQGITLHPVTR